MKRGRVRGDGQRRRVDRIMIQDAIDSSAD
jgi:hypothetical protein